MKNKSNFFLKVKMAKNIIMIKKIKVKLSKMKQKKMKIINKDKFTKMKLKVI